MGDVVLVVQAVKLGFELLPEGSRLVYAGYLGHLGDASVEDLVSQRGANLRRFRGAHECGHRLNGFDRKFRCEYDR